MSLHVVPSPVSVWEGYLYLKLYLPLNLKMQVFRCAFPMSEPWWEGRCLQP